MYCVALKHLHAPYRPSLYVMDVLFVYPCHRVIVPPQPLPPPPPPSPSQSNRSGAHIFDYLRGTGGYNDYSLDFAGHWSQKGNNAWHVKFSQDINSIVSFFFVLFNLTASHCIHTDMDIPVTGLYGNAMHSSNIEQRIGFSFCI